jgi:hypothetical protein
MKFNIKLTNDSRYCEVGQTNPLRWKTLFKEKDGSFIDQSGWIKCKDFFNDTLAYFKVGTKFSIYGYKNDIKKNEEGVYFLLKEIKDMDSFIDGLNVMNVRLFKDLKCEVAYWPQEKGQCVILLPNQIWESTYILSLATMIIRCANYGYKYKEWEDFFAPGTPMNTVEHAFTEKAKKFTKEHGFLVPKEYRKYWWFFNKQHNSGTNPNATGGTIHNNGACEWTNGMVA